MRRLLCVALLALPLGAARADVIFFDTFENDTLGLNGTLANWTVSDGTIDVIGQDLSGGALADFFPGNGLYIDLDGTSGDAATITSLQTFFFEPGTNYALTFAYGRNQETVTDETLLFEIAGLGQTLEIPASQVTLQTLTFAFVVGQASQSTIVFASPGGDNFGPVLDNVQLAVNGTTAVPLPATAPLLLGALAGLGWWRRRAAAHDVSSSSCGRPSAMS